MANHLANLVKKEIKEILRDPRLTLGMIIVPLLLFPILGSVMSGMISSVEETAYKPITVAALNFDEGNLSYVILEDPGFEATLDAMNTTLIVINASGKQLEPLIQDISENDSIAGAILIPRNFTSCVLNQQPARVEIYIPYRGSLFGQPEEGRIMAVVDVFKQILSAYIIVSLNPSANPVFVENPVLEDVNTVYEGEILEGVSPSMVSGLTTSRLFILPFALMMILIFAIQFASIAVASEKEQKTLETLLTLPIDRDKIVLGKLTGSIIVSAFGTIGFAIGFQYYMEQITSPFASEQELKIDLERLGLTLTTTDYALMISTVFLSLLAVLSLTMILASFAEDVRTAQSMVGVLVAPIAILPTIALFGIATGTFSESISLILLAIPFSSPMLAPLYIFQKQYLEVLVANILLAVQTFAYFKVAAWFFSSERVLTAKISFGRGKRVKELE